MKTIRLLLVLLNCSLIWAQADQINDIILQNSATLIYRNLEKGEKQAFFFAQEETRNAKTAEAFLILADAAYLKGDFASVMENLYESEKVAADAPGINILRKLYLARYYRIFGFNELAAQQLQSASEMLGNALPPKANGNVWARDHLESALSSADAEFKLKQLQLAQAMADAQSALALEIQIELASAFVQLGQYEKADECLELVIAQPESTFTARALLEKAAIAKAQSKPDADFLIRADQILSRHTDVPTQKEAFRLLADYHLQANQASDYKNYFERYKLVDAKLGRNLKDVRDRIILHLDRLKPKRSLNYYWFVAVALAALLAYGIRVYLKTKRDYQKFLKWVEKPIEDEIAPSRQMVIPHKTEQALLEKLSKFEKSNRFTNPNLTVVTLAKSLDTNTKYLSEVINRHKDMNFNQYVNELRINYIIAKMKQDPKYLNYKIYYLAKECGFSSQSTFSTVFRASTGISPLSFIKFLKNEHQTPA